MRALSVWIRSGRHSRRGVQNRRLATDQLVAQTERCIADGCRRAGKHRCSNGTCVIRLPSDAERRRAAPPSPSTRRTLPSPSPSACRAFGQRTARCGRHSTRRAPRSPARRRPWRYGGDEGGGGGGDEGGGGEGGGGAAASSDAAAAQLAAQRQRWQLQRRPSSFAVAATHSLRRTLRF